MEKAGEAGQRGLQPAQEGGGGHWPLRWAQQRGLRAGLGSLLSIIDSTLGNPIE